MRGPQQGGGDTEDAAAAAVVIGGFAVQVVMHQPVEAHGGGGMGTGAEGKAGIKTQHGGIRFGDGVFGRGHPKAVTKRDGLEVVKPGAHPVVVVQEVFSDGVVVAEGGAQDGEDSVTVAV